MKIRNAVLVAVLALGVGKSAYVAAAPTLVILDSLGGSYSFANAINNAGKVVGGSYTAGDAAMQAVIWNGATATSLGTVDGGYSYAQNINDSGVVVGVSSGRATAWNGNVPTDLGALTGGGTSFATAINNQGQIAGFANIPGHNTTATVWNGNTATSLSDFGPNIGYAINSTGQVAGVSAQGGVLLTGHATLWNGTTATDLGTLGGLASYAYGINDQGQVVGMSYLTGYSGVLGSPFHASIWNGITATDLGTLPGTETSAAYAINNSGDIVGLSGQSATVWTKGSMIDLNSVLSDDDVSAGWHLTIASDINDNGWIVGTARRGGIDYAFLLKDAVTPPITPVPEPGTYAMLLAGLGLLGLARRRKQNG